MTRTLLGVFVYALRKGGLRLPPVAEATTFADGGRASGASRALPG